MGCSSVVMDTVDELEQLSPLEADPSQIAVAIDLPKGFAIYPESAILTMAVSRKDLGQSQSEEFVLQQSGVERAVFKIAPTDLARLTQVQDQAHRWEVENPRATRGSVAVRALPCVLDSSADRSETFSVSLQLAANGPFMPLINQAKVSSVLSRSGLKELPVCPIELQSH